MSGTAEASPSRETRASKLLCLEVRMQENAGNPVEMGCRRCFAVVPDGWS